MECANNIELLSDFHDGTLDEVVQVEVRDHLALCQPCAGIFRDLDTIVMAATVLRAEQEITFPDENLIWQRMSITKRTFH